MGRLITVVGNTGVGKTTLVRQLCRLGNFAPGFEQHKERPYWRLFLLDHQRYAFNNQVDYLLYRAEQEVAIRQSPLDGIQDGGLDLDYFLFTRYFHKLGYLNQGEYGLCERVYNLIRSFQPPPDVIVWLDAPLSVIVHRFAKRGREIEITKLRDLEALQQLLDEWLDRETSVPVIRVDASLDDPDYQLAGTGLLSEIRKTLDKNRDICLQNT